MKSTALLSVILHGFFFSPPWGFNTSVFFFSLLINKGKINKGSVEEIIEVRLLFKSYPGDFFTPGLSITSGLPKKIVLVYPNYVSWFLD